MWLEKKNEGPKVVDSYLSMPMPLFITEFRVKICLLLLTILVLINYFITLSYLSVLL
jgi:hypothetical protein